MTIDMARSAVSARLRDVARLSDLRADGRLDAKLDMRASSVTRRLRTVGSLTSLCLRLGRRSSPGESAAEEDLRLRAKTTRLAGLLAEEAGLLATEHETLGRGRREILARIRAETAALADSIRSGLLANPRLLRNLELHYACLLGQQAWLHGFPFTPAVSEVARGIASHASPRPRPTMLVGPPSFPLATLARIALSGVPIPWPAPGPRKGTDSAREVLQIELTNLLPVLLVHDSPFPISAIGALVVTGFWDVDWAAQRALCDRAVSLGIPLVVIAACDPAGPGARDFAGYSLPEIEIGVSDRLFKTAVPPPRSIDEQSIRQWLLDSSCWREGLLPLAQLAAGWAPSEARSA